MAPIFLFGQISIECLIDEELGQPWCYDCTDASDTVLFTGFRIIHAGVDTTMIEAPWRLKVRRNTDEWIFFDYRDQVKFGHVDSLTDFATIDELIDYVQGCQTFTVIYGGGDSAAMVGWQDTMYITYPEGSGGSDTTYSWPISVNGGTPDTIVNLELVNLVAGSNMTITQGTTNITFDADDDQQVDLFDIMTNTLRLDIENDGQPIHTVDLTPYLDNTDSNVDSVKIIGTTLWVYEEGDSVGADFVQFDRDTIYAFNGLTKVGQDSVKLGGLLIERTRIHGSDGNLHWVEFDSISRFYIETINEFRVDQLTDGNIYFQQSQSGNQWKYASNNAAPNNRATYIAHGGSVGMQLYVGDSASISDVNLSGIVGIYIDTNEINVRTPNIRDGLAQRDQVLTYQGGTGGRVEFQDIGVLVIDSDTLKRKPFHIAFYGPDSLSRDTVPWDTLVLMNDLVRWLYMNDSLNAVAIGKGARADNLNNSSFGAYAFPFQPDTITEAITNTQIDTVNEVITGLTTYIAHLADLGYSQGDNLVIDFSLVSGQMPFTDSAVYMAEGQHLFNIASPSTLRPVYFEFDSVETGSYELVANKFLTNSTALGAHSIVDRNRQVALGDTLLEEVKFAKEIRFDVDTNFTHNQFYRFDSATQQLHPFWWSLEDDGVVFWKDGDFRTRQEHFNFDSASNVGINGLPVATPWRLSVYGGLAVVEDPTSLGRAQIRMGDTTLNDWFWFTEADDDSYEIRSYNKNAINPNLQIDTAGQFWYPFYAGTEFEKTSLSGQVDKILLTDGSGFVWNIRLDSLADQLSITASADSIGTTGLANEIIYRIGGRGAESEAGFEYDPSTNDLLIPDDVTLSAFTGTAKDQASTKITNVNASGLLGTISPDDLEAEMGGPFLPSSSNNDLWTDAGSTTYLTSTDNVTIGSTSSYGQALAVDGTFVSIGAAEFNSNATFKSAGTVIFQGPIQDVLGGTGSSGLVLKYFNSGGNDRVRWQNVDWSELTGIPGGFSDGVDDTGPWTDAGVYTYLTTTSDNVHIGGSTNPPNKLYVTGTFGVTSTSAFTGEATFSSAARFNDGIKDFLGGLGTSGQVLKWFSGNEVRWQQVLWSDLGSIPAGFADNVDNEGVSSLFWDADGSSATELTSGETFGVTGGTDITTSRSGNTVTISYSGSGGNDDLGFTPGVESVVYGGTGQNGDSEAAFWYDESANTLNVDQLAIDGAGGSTITSTNSLSLTAASGNTTINSSGTTTISDDGYFGANGNDQVRVQTTSTQVSLNHEANNDSRIYLYETGSIEIDAGGSGDDVEIDAADIITIRPGSYTINVGEFGVNRNPSTDIFEVAGDAGKTVGGADWNTISDQRIKKNIAEIDRDTALAKFRQLKPSMYMYTDYWMTEAGADSVYYYSYIAQEVESILPEAVREINEYLPGDPNKIKQLQNDIISSYQAAALIENIDRQEANHDLIDDLMNRVEALEAILFPASLSLPTSDREKAIYHYKELGKYLKE